jgi:hypothetical protein
MFKLEITVTPKNQIVIDDPMLAFNYLFSFYTAEQQAQFGIAMKQITDEGVIISHDTDSDLAIYQAKGVVPLSVDTANNSITVRYLLNKPEVFCGRFVNDWDAATGNNMAPLADYFSNPVNGSYSFKIYDTNGTDVTATYYDNQHLARLFS